MRIETGRLAGSITKRHRKFRYGFTLVELIAVIAVIAILAGVAIIGFGAWRTRVAETEVKNDLAGVKAGMDDARNRHNGYPVFPQGAEFDGSASTKDIFRSSSGVRITYYGGSATNYCVDLRSRAVDSVYMFLDTSGGNSVPKVGTCEGGEGAAPFNSSLASQFTLTSNTTDVTSITVDHSKGDIYYKVSSTAPLWKFSTSTGQATNIATGFDTDAIAYGGGNIVYVFVGSKIQTLNVTNGQRVDVSPTITGPVRSMHKDGNILYLGAWRNVFSYNLDTGSLQDLYYTGGAGIREVVVVGDDVYFTRSSSLMKVPKAGGSAQIIGSLPGLYPGTASGGLVHRGGVLYHIARDNSTKSIYGYNIASGVWTNVIQDIAYVPAMPYSCVRPDTLGIYGPRIIYFSSQPETWAGSCSVIWSNARMYLTQIP